MLATCQLIEFRPPPPKPPILTCVVGMLFQVFQLPKALAYPLFYKLVAPNSSSVTRDAILTWFDEKNVVQV